MPNPGDHLSIPASDPLEVYLNYTVSLKQRLDDASNVLHQGIALTADLDQTNLALGRAGRPDLVLAEPAAMMAITSPREVISRQPGNNFSPHFSMRVGKRDTGELDYRDRPIMEIIPPTESDVLHLKGMPKIGDYNHYREIEASGEYPLLGLNHASKPAFLRMLILFPGFTSRLVVNMSQPENRTQLARYEPELFAAYQVMSRLVDKTDYSVVDEQSGQVDDWYLSR